MEGTIEHGVEVRGILAELDRIAAEMTVATLPLLVSVTPARYRSILSLCYHYTRASGAQLERAAELAPDDDLREYFASMADEERNHFRLAEADLAAMGGAVHTSRPIAVDRFADYWNGITSAKYFEFLGATHVLENIAGRLRDHVVAAVAALGLSRRQSRFARTHLEADVEHGARVRELCARYADGCGPALIAGAQAAAHWWMEGAESLAGESR
jgi:Iron-containing redox enzyme